MRRVVGMREMPARGADFFLVDRIVIEALRNFRERNVSVLALVTWLGFRQTLIEYDKQPRAAGQSGWTLQKKIKLVLDSVIGFSDVPIRLCSYLGVALVMTGVALGLYGVFRASTATVLVTAVMVGLTGVQLLALGIVGEYVWRGLDEARARPAYLIEAATGRHEHALSSRDSQSRDSQTAFHTEA
jgi:dolichol-phosphate mannosyltransferase